jgi:hypothetical protein
MRMALWAGMAAAALLAGCSDDIQDPVQGEGTAPAAAADPDSPEPLIFENNEWRDDYLREFKYNWPAAVSAVPALVQRFTAERDAALAEQKQDFEAALREFGGGDCTGCVNRSFEKSWQVVADLPRFLSLSASLYFYTGGAHGNGGYDALVWDREAEAVLAPEDFFVSPAAVQAALGEAWCKGLSRERKKRLGEDYSEDGFFPCPEVAELTVLLGSSDKQVFNRIGLIAAPYVAGSYAEGTYEVTLPVTPKVIEAVKPKYRAYFAAPK